MSDELKQFTLRNAKKFNIKNVPKLVSFGGIPEDAVLDYPGLGGAAGSDEFSTAVFDLQRDLGLSSDGMFGRSTWNMILKNYDTVDVESNYVVLGGRRLPLPNRGSYTVISYDELISDEGTCGIKPLDLHPVGHFSARKKDIGGVIMHWGGLDPKHLHAVMSSPDRKVSTHFGIGLLNDTPVVMQYLDLKHKAWHAGFGNEGTIGVDICQQPTYKWVGHYQKNGYDVRRKDNPTNRGNVKIISLDPRIAEATNDFVRDLLDAFGLPFNPPDHHDVIHKDSLCRDYTLVGHHHLVSKKWDIACWWSDIFDQGVC